MKKVLVIGATGAMGRYLVPELVSLGYEVTGVALDDVAPWQGMARYIKGDAFDMDFLKSLISECYDGIISFMDYGGNHFTNYYELFLNLFLVLYKHEDHHLQFLYS